MNTVNRQTVAHLSDSSQLVIQNAVPSDAEKIVEIGAATFAASFAHSMPAAHMQSYLDTTYTTAAILRELADTTRNHFLVARRESTNIVEGSKVVGFIQMKLGTTEPCLPPDVPMIELHRIYVSTDHFGGGTGQSMMGRGLSWARQQLLSPDLLNRAASEVGRSVNKRKAGIWLGVWEENLKAQRFYRRWGFEIVGAHDFVMGETRQTDLIMVKWL